VALTDSSPANNALTLNTNHCRALMKSIPRMNRKCIPVANLLLLALFGAVHAADTQPANIVLFLIDDLGWKDLGCQGSAYYRTPNIDQLASEGVRFTDAYAACAVCSPTRAAILTGKYPARLLLTDWLPSGRWDPKARLREGRFLRGLSVEEFTLAEALREAGYRTASIGKWHLGSEPFSLYFPHYGVHTPLQAKTEVIAKYDRTPEDQRQGKPEYAAMVESIDDSVGRVLATLRELSLADNTVVIFTSDNGGFYNATSNAPLRANKGAYYEGGIRVPLIIKWPGVAVAGRVVTEPVTSTDLYPTCLAVADQPLRPHQHIDGVDLQPLMTGKRGIAPRSLFWRYPHYNSHPSSVPSSVIRKGHWKLIESFDPAGMELYNLADDLSETNNLAKSEPDIVTELHQELEAWRVSVGAERMLPNPDYDPSIEPTKRKRAR
jgi:arylsulfatase A